ncbi:MAG: hypothetical protein K9G76_09795 [Bacteroidales bacterium]|nr:hypothetical protein [Bacteroidales bacterium]MCF8403991.1 hypothetical protein [Bacteroidales bacterium]
MQNLKFLLILICLSFTVMLTAQTIHHNLDVDLSIDNKSIDVIDSITFPGAIINGKSLLMFTLNKNLQPESLDGSIQVSKIIQNNEGAIYNSYKIELNLIKQGDITVPIKYSGAITEEISTGADEYARGFSETNGIITDKGVYLAGSTYWVPSFDLPLLTYTLSVNLRNDWNVVSQGERITNRVTGERRKVEYICDNPTEEVYLISAGWTEYEKMAGNVLVQAFLRTPDEELANRYIDATSGYLKMYVDLVGPYPYQKFALVENFWETGYGMPSFTLLGEKIIRFPWILTTSYPHELLHNWWGNSVYVDFEKGNWCEGLTAYMADHLLKEQAGQGADYRRNTLQKFTDYVNPENDFPVIEFRSRNNSAEEAIGYGKCLMFNHMLRKMVGDENYIKAYQGFYQNNIYKISTFDNILESFQSFSKTDLKPVFDQWLTRKGAPSFQLSNVSTQILDEGFNVVFTLSQNQKDDVFIMDVPVAIYLKDKIELVKVTSDKRSNKYSFMFPSEPVKIEVDPQFDVFRRLDKSEVPPCLSQIFGESDGMIVLPGNSPLLEEYKTLAETWSQAKEAEGKFLKVIFDNEIETLPDLKSIWIIGFENKFAGLFDMEKEYRPAFDAGQFELVRQLLSAGSLVYSIPNPENNAFTIGFVGTNVKEAVPGLARLLPHYGKYSFLGFEGERPNNVLKGNFPALNSPLFYTIPYEGKYLETSAALNSAKPLIGE